MPIIFREGVALKLFNMFRSRQVEINQQFTELFEPLNNELYLYIYTIIRNEFLADDVMQETLYKAYINFSKLKEKDKFKYWILSIAKREALNMINKCNKEAYIVQEELEMIEDYSEDFYNKGSYYEVLDVVSDIIDNLPEEQKDLIVKTYHMGFTLDEIATMSNTNLNTIKSRHFRTKNVIENELVKRGFDTNRIKSGQA